MTWKDELEGPKWLSALGTAEGTYGLPTDLLARIAYQESHFRPEIIDGTLASPAGALGMMQLMPQYFSSVRVPIPFSFDDTSAQIEEAAKFLASLQGSTHNWSLTVAAYNAGLGNVEKYGGIPPFPETEDYVREILADVTAAGVADV